MRPPLSLLPIVLLACLTLVSGADDPLQSHQSCTCKQSTPLLCVWDIKIGASWPSGTITNNAADAVEAGILSDGHRRCERLRDDLAYGTSIYITNWVCEKMDFPSGYSGYHVHLRGFNGDTNAHNLNLILGKSFSEVDGFNCPAK